MSGLVVALVGWLPLLALAAGPAGPERIDIFTHMGEAVANVSPLAKQVGDRTAVQYFVIDAQARLEATLSKDLPADPDQARAIALQRIRKLDRSRLARALRESYEGLTRARQYGIDRIPAIVFDGGKSVVYGVTDLQEAVRRYRQSGAGRQR